PVYRPAFTLIPQAQVHQTKAASIKRSTLPLAGSDKYGAMLCSKATAAHQPKSELDTSFSPTLPHAVQATGKGGIKLCSQTDFGCGFEIQDLSNFTIFPVRFHN